MPRAVPLLLASILLLLPVLGAPETQARDEMPATITVLGARVEPLTSKGKPWDADHGAVPQLVYRQLASASGFPPLSLLALIPYRNRPDPFVLVEAEGEEWARSSALQGTFLPAWMQEVEMPRAPDRPAVLTFRVLDDDLQKDDEIGKAVVDLAAVLAEPGLHTVEGTRGLYDLSFVVRNPAAEDAGPRRKIDITRLQLTVRATRPAGGDWDAGGNPLRRRFPKLKIPKRLEGLPTVRPDLRATVTFSAGGLRQSDLVSDALEMDWKDVGLVSRGRRGVGDGLYLRVVDEDLALADPVGVLFVPFEAFLDAAADGHLEVEGDEMNGIERVRMDFTLE